MLIFTVLVMPTINQLIFLLLNLKYIMGWAGHVETVNLVPLLMNLIVRLGKSDVKIMRIARPREFITLALPRNTSWAPHQAIVQ